MKDRMTLNHNEKEIVANLKDRLLAIMQLSPNEFRSMMSNKIVNKTELYSEQRKPSARKNKKQLPQIISPPCDQS